MANKPYLLTFKNVDGQVEFHCATYAVNTEVAIKNVIENIDLKTTDLYDWGKRSQLFTENLKTKADKENYIRIHMNEIINYLEDQPDEFEIAVIKFDGKPF